MSNNAFTRVVGLIYLLLGICGFIPAAVRQPTPLGEQVARFHFGYLFNGLPMNYPLAGLFILIGLGGLIASAKIRQSRRYERILFTLSMVLMVMGFTPGLSNVWGLMPLFGFTDGLFLCTALFSFYFAFVEGPLMPSINEPVDLHLHHHQ
jgi:uncharacterized membrane protein